MDKYREQAAEKTPHEISDALQQLLDAAKRGEPGYAAADRHRHVSSDREPVIPGRENADRQARAAFAREALQPTSGLETGPVRLEPIEENPDFQEIYSQFAPEDEEIGLDALTRDLSHRIGQASDENERSDLTNRLAGSKRRYDELREARLKHLGDAMMPMLELRQAYLTKFSADVADYRPLPVAERSPHPSGSEWTKAEVKVEDIAAAWTLKNWGGDTASPQRKRRNDGELVDTDLYIRELARDIALGKETDEETHVFVAPRTLNDGREVYQVEGGELTVAAFKLLGRTEVTAEIKQYG